jgi:import inner membrane translocase subunit TIM23
LRSHTSLVLGLGGLTASRSLPHSSDQQLRPHMESESSVPIQHLPPTSRDLFSFGQDDDDEPDYLEFNYRGRPYYEKLFYNSGLAYTSGSIGGALFGAARGLASAPSDKLRVRVNGLLNGAGKFGSRGGNGMGVLALYYTTAEQLINMSGLEEYHNGGVTVNQAIAGAISGCLYKGTKRPATIALAGVFGGGIIAASSMAEVWWMTGGTRFW